ncbi:TPA: MurR/RpiR family transcriptional regulator [Streptococcus suis]|nr:MurR/RpiR family transcriptional regulator [Streptococcus suis]HEM4953152.1 MurR/RpiR family transcriptional regulator [Streptococcus suis]
MVQSINILEVIKNNYEIMSNSEKIIADYFLNESHYDEDLSAERMTKFLYVSKSALTRFAKKCGFSGYREFVFEFQFSQKYLTKTYSSFQDITTKIFFEYNELMEKTKSIISEIQLESIANMIDEAKRVYFYGMRSSGFVASEAHLRFMRLGVACEAVTEPDLMNWTNGTLDDTCLVFGFSLSGQTKTVINALAVAHSKGAKTVLLSSEKNYLTRFSEHVQIANERHLNYGTRISPQFPLMLLVDIIYAYFKRNDSGQKEKIYKESLESIGNSEKHNV